MNNVLFREKIGATTATTLDKYAELTRNRHELAVLLINEDISKATHREEGLGTVVSQLARQMRVGLV